MKVTSSVLAILAFTASAFADAEPRIKSRKGLCGYPGVTCAKAKRAAEAVSNALANAEPRIKSRKGLCGYPGTTCAKARSPLASIEDALSSTVDTVFERDADAEAEARIKSRKGLCGYPGVTCAKARSAAPEARIKSKKTGCGYPGTPCRRGLDLINEAEPELFKEECFEEGGECHTILAAAEAFHEVTKREAEPINVGKWKWGPKYWHKGSRPSPRIKSYLSACGYPGVTCARDTHELAAADARGEVDLEKEFEACNGPDGDCTVVQASLDELEETLTKAVAEVYKL